MAIYKYLTLYLVNFDYIYKNFQIHRIIVIRTQLFPNPNETPNQPGPNPY